MAPIGTCDIIFLPQSRDRTHLEMKPCKIIRSTGALSASAEQYSDRVPVNQPEIFLYLNKRVKKPYFLEISFGVFHFIEHTAYISNYREKRERRKNNKKQVFNNSDISQ